MNPLHILDFPRSICIRITRKCNAACVFCQAPDTDSATVTADDFEIILRALRHKGVESVKLSGGEPTVRGDLPHLLRLAAMNRIKPTVVTNGLRIRDSLIAAGKEAAAEFKFSIHHYSEENDRIIGRRGFKAIVKNALQLRGEEIPLAVNTVITRHNIEIMTPMVQFAGRIGARKISFIPFVPRGRGLHHEKELELGLELLRKVHESVRMLNESRRDGPEVRIIDIRRRPYWIIENDCRLWIERYRETDDELVGSKEQLLEIGR